jgi:hypothetical protein
MVLVVLGAVTAGKTDGSNRCGGKKQPMFKYTQDIPRVAYDETFWRAM